MARPTKYNKNKLKIVKDYLADCMQSNQTPFISELSSLKLGVDRVTLYLWMAKKKKNGSPKYPELIYTIKILKEYQRFRLQKDTLAGKAPERSSIFMLKANHNMKDTSVIEHTGKDGTPLFDRSIPERDRHKKLLSEASEKLEAMGVQMPSVKELEAPDNDKQ